MAYHVCSCFIFLLFQHLYLCLKILLLKPDLFFDLLSCHGHIFRNCHPFVFHIIKAVDDSYHFSCKLFYRVIDSQNVNVLFLTVRSDDSFDVAAIYRIKKLFVFRMITVHWTVDHDMYKLAWSRFLLFINHLLHLYSSLSTYNKLTDFSIMPVNRRFLFQSVLRFTISQTLQPHAQCQDLSYTDP